jgi:hypothetical protein
MLACLAQPVAWRREAKSELKTPLAGDADVIVYQFDGFEISRHTHQTMVLQSRDTRLIIMVCKSANEGTARRARRWG